MKSPIREINGPEMARSSPGKAISQRAGESKADSRYWLQGKRLQFHDSPEYSARFQLAGRREWFPLGTPNKRGAASKAAEVYAYIQAHGMEAALQRYKPKPSTAATKAATIGDLIRVASECSNARRDTLDAYVKALRRIVSEVKGIQDGRKFDAFKGGTAEWRERVDAIRVDSIAPADVLAWKNSRLQEVGTKALQKRSATVTVNSLIRNAKSLLGKKLLPFIKQKIDLPATLPFEGITMEKAPSQRYSSKVDALALLARAKEELAENDPEGYKVLILALVCGLRRSEIDHLLWRAFDFSSKVLRIEATEYHELKSEDSSGEIDLDADITTLFKAYRQKAPKDLFVIHSNNPPRNQTKSRCYRCNETFARVNEWLRSQGVQNKKPLHTMRKEIGSIIASEEGIFAASRYLRHSDIRITNSIYADKKKTITPKAFAGILGAATVISDQPQSQTTAAA